MLIKAEKTHQPTKRSLANPKPSRNLRRVSLFFLSFIWVLLLGVFSVTRAFADSATEAGEGTYYTSQASNSAHEVATIDSRNSRQLISPWLLILGDEPFDEDEDNAFLKKLLPELFITTLQFCPSYYFDNVLCPIPSRCPGHSLNEAEPDHIIRLQNFRI